MVRLFGQLGISNLENNFENDSELVSLFTEEEEPIELNKECVEIDFDLRDVNDQVSDLQKETSSFIFKTNVKASSSKEHSNDQIMSHSVEINEESLYAINTNSEENGGRKVLLLKNLKINLGKLNSEIKRFLGNF